jgi:hypothetical protein
MEAGPWNWLEVAKLISVLLTPVALAIFGIYVHRITKRFEHLQWRSQKLIEKRLEIFDDLATDLNDLLCYFTYVGSWRDFDPPSIVGMKRQVDKKIHLACPLFGKEFFDSCQEFQDLCFETYNGWGEDAKLKTQSHRRRQARGKTWKDEWDSCFSNDVTSAEEIRSAYTNVMMVLARDIGVNESFFDPKSMKSATPNS